MKEQEASIAEVVKEIGIAWFLPHDGRIRLSFDLYWLQQDRKSRDALESKIQTIKKFYDNRGRFLDFYILDSNLAKSDHILAIYRPGSCDVEMYSTQNISSKPIKLRKPTIPEWPIDQWGRVIFCQGLSSVLDLKTLVIKRPLSYSPYLVARSDEDPIYKTIKLRLECSRRLGSKLANPSSDDNNGFHITFYEKVESFSDVESWKTGDLYEKAAGPKSTKQRFRQSAFTTDVYNIEHVPKLSHDA
ncbi:hypothetical protein CJF32_00011124 [Rutstroemia sp. NJR-2017a WRK4]|nr:hypothetical protein CJF32_00011124 [Rutstroemia sp. NJR-2017a WRK4]